MKYDFAKDDHIPMNSCYCMGPKDGQPLCPCKMKNVIIRDGMYVISEKVIGPVPSSEKLNKLV